MVYAYLMYVLMAGKLEIKIENSLQQKKNFKFKFLE